MLRHIARKGTPPQREAALATLATDSTHRLGRATTQISHFEHSSVTHA